MLAWLMGNWVNILIGIAIVLGSMSIVFVMIECLSGVDVLAFFLGKEQSPKKVIVSPFAESIEQFRIRLERMLVSQYALMTVDEYGVEHYGTALYENKEDAEKIAQALQEAYMRTGYDVRFRVCLQFAEE